LPSSSPSYPAFPGVVYAAAGWARMQLSTFLLLDILGAVLMTAVIAGLGYGLGQRAVDILLTIDRYASAVSLTMITVALLIPVIKRRIQRKSTPVED
jgi:membrane protein DedA with SNARE-associated domain